MPSQGAHRMVQKPRESLLTGIPWVHSVESKNERKGKEKGKRERVQGDKDSREIKQRNQKMQFHKFLFPILQIMEFSCME